MTEMTAMEEAIADCKYALSLDNGNGTFVAFYQHYLHWRGATLVCGTYDAEYAKCVMEIKEKFRTEQCLVS